MTTPAPVYVPHTPASYRVARGYSRDALALRLGACKRTLLRIERGDHVRFGTLERVARELAITPGQLLDAQVVVREQRERAVTT